MPLFADSTSRLTCHAAWSNAPTVRDMVLEGLIKYAAPLPPTFKLHAPDLLSLGSGEKDQAMDCGDYSLRAELAPGSSVASDAQARQAWVAELDSALRSGDYKSVLRNKLYWLGGNKGRNLRRGAAKASTTGWEAWLAPVLDGSATCDLSSAMQLSSSSSGRFLTLDPLCVAGGSSSCVLAVAAYLATQAPVLHLSLVPRTLSTDVPPEGPPTRRSVLTGPRTHELATFDAPQGLSATREIKRQTVDPTQSSDNHQRKLDEVYVENRGPSYGLDALELWAAGINGEGQLVQVSRIDAGVLSLWHCRPR